MSKEEIIEKLFGKIMPVGETYEDKKRFENLLDYNEILEIIINKIVNCSNYNNDNRYSVCKIGVESMNILINLRNFLEDVLLEIEGE